MPASLDHSSVPVPPPDWIALVREKVEGLRFGVVQLVVHDGRVTQIERTEKTRLFTHHTTHHKPEILGGIQETDASAILKTFFERLRP